MSVNFRPMLATDADLTKLRFPLLASPKLDGIRAVVRNGMVYSRSNKPIPNKFVQRKFSKFAHHDGELIVGEPTSKTVYRDTVSGVMSVDGEPDVRFYVFDHIECLSSPYRIRAEKIDVSGTGGKPSGGVLVWQSEINDLQDLLMAEQSAIDFGYEGLILRDPNAPYKMGRSTMKEGYLLKLKRFVDFEAEVVGFEERMRNDNVATVSELGRTKRSSHKENKHGRGDLGALLLRTADGIEFACGTGFTDTERAAIWAARPSYIGKLAKIKAFPVGGYDAPRHPVFLGWRDVRDM